MRITLNDLEALEPADLVFTDKAEGDTWSDYIDPRAMFKVGRMTEEGTWEVLVECETYAEADHACALWEHRYPCAWVDILDGSLTLVD